MNIPTFNAADYVTVVLTPTAARGLGQFTQRRPGADDDRHYGHRGSGRRTSASLKAVDWFVDRCRSTWRLPRRRGGGGPLPQGARGRGQRGWGQEGGQGGRGGADWPLQTSLASKLAQWILLRQGDSTDISN